jgi:hypothetical protein
VETTSIVIAALVMAAVIVGLLVYVRRRDAALRERFGPEYDRTVTEVGSRGARSELSAREKRVSGLDIRPLDPMERESFAARWTQAQGRFVDEPRGAIAEADALVAELMRSRGYPVEDFEQRAADLSVEHAGVVHDYRAAHGISMASDRDMASTEDQRQAMIHYRSLFAQLLGDGGSHGESEAGGVERRATIDLREEEGQFRYR